MMTKEYRGTKQYGLVYTELITASKYRGTVTYQEIAKLIGLPLTGQYMSGEIGRLLGDISEDENKNSRPMLSAVAVSADGYPGPGFFVLARELGRLDSAEKNAERLFWEQERKKVYEEWKVILPTEKDKK